jgi:hypothetical protein
MSASCWYEPPNRFSNAPNRGELLKSYNSESYQQWKRDEQAKIDNEKAKDPKTVFGWAIKGIKK